MKDCKPLPTPMGLNEKLSQDNGKEKMDETIYRSLVGLLIYLTKSRLDTVHVVNIVSRFMSTPSKTHFIVAKRILRYVKGTKFLASYTSLRVIPIKLATPTVTGQVVSMSANHKWICISFKIENHFMGIKETKDHSTFVSRSGIYGRNNCYSKISMVKKDFKGFAAKHQGTNKNLMRQHVCNSHDKKFNIP